MSNCLPVSPIPQRTITVSVHGSNDDHYMTYSYWSPITGETVHDAPVCDLHCNQPTYFMFILDWESTLAGWTINGSVPRKNTPALQTTPGPFSLSIVNFNPYVNDYDVYHFALNYFNTQTGVSSWVDPQEGNIPGKT